MDAAILFASVGALVPEALRHTAKDETVVCADIHMSDVPGFLYSILWGSALFDPLPISLAVMAKNSLRSPPRQASGQQ